MNKSIIQLTPVVFTNITVEPEEPVYVTETPVETVIRRLAELHLTGEDMHDGLYTQSPGLERIKTILEEEDYPTYQEIHALLYYVGMSLVAVDDGRREYQASNGHWFCGSRCQYCGVNDLDAGLYDPDVCPNKPE